MTDAIAGTSRARNDWPFLEEPPPKPLSTSTTGVWSPPVWATALTTPLVPLPTTLSQPTTPFAAITGTNKTFQDSPALALEVVRLKNEAANPKNAPELRAALTQQVVVRQAQWVAGAKAEGRREPNGALDPIHAKPAEIANALLWSEAGGVIPRGELAHDGGRAFLTSVRDAVTLRTRGFDAMIDLHAGKPSEQRSLIASELGRLGVATPPGDPSVDELLGVRRNVLASQSADQRRTEEENQLHRIEIGLDGRVGTAAGLDAYERDAGINAMNPGTTTGSLLASLVVAIEGRIDIQKMRLAGSTGDALEGAFGGVGTPINKVAIERNPLGTVKPTIDDFNRTGIVPRFRVTDLQSHYEKENIPGENHWTAGGAPKTDTVKYYARHEDRAPFKLEARAAPIGGGKTEMRLFDAEGKLFDTGDAATVGGRNRAIFVMNAQGEMFSSTYQEVKYMHHSSLAGGAPVAAAGEIVVENGKLVSISNRSGHYRPSAELNEQFITALREKGLNLSGVVVIDAATETRRRLR